MHADTAAPVTFTGTATRQDSAGLPFSSLPVTLAPHRALLTYYMLGSLLLGPFFIFAMAFGWFRYHTLRYDIDEQGITMRWGILFRREVSLAYARIQDIQLSSNLVERWLGLAKIQLQTASGSSGAEMTIEGVREIDALRDFLYARTRGANPSTHPRSGAAHVAAERDVDALAESLNAVAAELRALRLERTAPRSGVEAPQPDRNLPDSEQEAARE